MAYTTINKPNTKFNTIIYTGNNNQSQTISGVGFQPDWIWIKNSDNVEWHHLMDVVRGDNKFLHTNNTDAESTGNRGNGHNALAFTSDGFSITNAGSLDGDLNFGSRPYPTWCWKADGTASSNTDGTITSSVSVNTDSGVSIVTWTGTGANATVGHGLGSVPKMIIVKNRNVVTNWIVGGSLIEDVGGSTNNYMILNGTAAMDTSTTLYASYNTDTIGVKTDANINGSGNGMLAYCFAEKQGFSKFSTFTGNGNADGTFVYTGFKPAFFLWKNTTSAGYYWHIMDNERNPTNPAGESLFPNLVNAEIDYNSGNACDFLSNGFKFRTGSDGINATNQVYIYMAFAENPLVGTNNVPATAR